MAGTKPRKRKLSTKSTDPDDGGDHSNSHSPKPKRLSEESSSAAEQMPGTFISAVEFKFLLGDKATLMDGLDKFIKSADAFSDGATDQDIVANYCRSTDGCKELLDVLEGSDAKTNLSKVVPVFQCIEKILTRIRGDLSKFSSMGEAVVQKLMTAYLDLIYITLRDQNKSNVIKSGLLLLIAMSMHSHKTKAALQARMHFEHPSYPQLFKRRNRKDPQDVRNCMILLTLTFLLDSDQSVVNALVAQRGFLHMVIGGLKFDSRDVVVDFLATLLDKVVKSTTVTKTAKFKLFSENILRQIFELFNWVGPAGWSAGGGKGKAEEKMDTSDESFLADRESVADVAFSFLVEVCCSHKYGVNFVDKAIGTGKRNHNQLLSHFLTHLAKHLTEPRASTLATRIIEACPDLASGFLSSLSAALTPRWSTMWEMNIDFVSNIFASFPDVPSFLTTTGADIKSDSHDVITMATVFCLPPAKVVPVLASGLKHDDERVLMKILQLLSLLLRKANAIHERLMQLCCGQNALSGDIPELFVATVLKTLPSPALVFGCVDKVMARIDKGFDPTKEDSAVDLGELTCSLLEVLTQLHTLTPSLLTERPKDLTKVVALVGKLPQQLEGASFEKNEKLAGTQKKKGITKMETDADESIEEVKEKDEQKVEEEEEEKEGGDKVDVEGDKKSPQLCLLILLSRMDATKIGLGREGLLEKLLLTGVSGPQHRKLTVQLVCEMLGKLDILTSHKDELTIWLNTALPLSALDSGQAQSEERTVANLAFLSRCIASLINNPAPFVDRVMDAVAEVSMGGLMQGQCANSKKDQGNLEDILSMKDSELDKLLTHSGPITVPVTTPLPFSPLVVVALDSLQYRKTDDKSLRDFVSGAVLRLVHSQVDPVVLCRVVSQSQATLSEGMREYIGLWSQENMKTKQTSKLPDTNVMGDFSAKLAAFHKGNNSSLIEEIKQAARVVAPEEVSVSVGHVMLLVRHLMDQEETEQAPVKKMRQLWDVVEVLFDNLMKTYKSTSEQDEKTDEGFQTNNDLSSLTSLKTKQGQGHIEAAKALEFILTHPVVESLLFPTSAPSPKSKEVKFVQALSKQLGGVLASSSRLKDRQEAADVLKTFTSHVIKALSKFDHLPSGAQDIYLDSLWSVAPLLDIPEFPEYFSALLSQPESSLLADVDGEGHLSRMGQLTLQFVESGLTKLGESTETLDMSLSSADQAAPLVRLRKYLSVKVRRLVKGNVWNDSSASEIGNINISKSFELSNPFGWDLNKFCPLIDLLLKCDDEVIDNCVLKLFKTLPKCIDICSSKVCKLLQSSPDTLSPSRREILCLLIGQRAEVTEWCDKIFHTPVKTLSKGKMWWLLKAFLKTCAGQKNPVTSTDSMTALRKYLSKKATEILSSGDEKALECLALMAGLLGDEDQAYHKEILSSLISLMSKHTGVQAVHFDILKLSVDALTLENTHSNLVIKESQSPVSSSLEACLKHLAFLASDKSRRDDPLADIVLGISQDLVTKMQQDDGLFLSALWPSFVKSTLRVWYTKAPLLHLLSDLLPKVYGQSPQTKSTGSSAPALPSTTLFQMCISHTAFLDTMMATDQAKTAVKEALVCLLYSLCDLDPDCCKTQLSNVLASAYSASLSLTDQRLLLMMEKFALAKGEKFECPSLWGSALLEQRSVSQALGPSLTSQVAVKQILAQIDPVRLQKSILNFPLRAAYDLGQLYEAEKLKSDADCYSPRFLLRLFSQILSPDQVVPVRQFVDKGCLSYLLIALSSHDRKCRLAAYAALNDFYTHAEGSRCAERVEIAFLLDLLNASRSKSTQKLPFMLALFFARVVKLMLNPGESVYMSVMRFLTAKPELDLTSVPEFYQMFFSAKSQFRQERTWILSLLRDGLRETSDYRLMQKHFIFKIIFSFYDSSLSDPISQIAVLQAVERACQEKSMAVDLVKLQGLSSWLASVIAGLSQQPQHTDLVCSILHTLWVSLSTTQYQNVGQADTAALQTKDSGNESVQEQNKENLPSKKLVKDGIEEEEKEMDEEGDDDDDEDEEEDGDSDGDSDEHKDEKKKSPKLNKEASAHVSQLKVGDKTKRQIPSVPKSTLVEIGAMAKALIPHLRHASTAHVQKVVMLINSLLAHVDKETNRQIDSQTAVSPISSTVVSAGNAYLPLSVLDCARLLWSVSRATGHVTIASSLQELLAQSGAGLSGSRTLQDNNPVVKSVGKKEVSEGKNVEEEEEEENDEGEESKGKEPSPVITSEESFVAESEFDHEETFRACISVLVKSGILVNSDSGRL